jgi:hypothetical protein
MANTRLIGSVAATLIDLAKFPMPFHNGDLESHEGLPANGRHSRQLLLAFNGHLISSPEYNSSIPGALKNAIDWASRQESVDAGSLVRFQHKIAGLVRLSPGNLGGRPYEDIALIGAGAENRVDLRSFTSEGRRSHDTASDLTGLQAQAGRLRGGDAVRLRAHGVLAGKRRRLRPDRRVEERGGLAAVRRA